MDEVQSIYSEIGSILQGLAPPKAREMVCDGKDYPDFASARIYWLDAAGKQGRPFESRRVSGPSLQIGALMRRFKETAADADFTHYRVRRAADGTISTDFALIPPEQSWARVYMRPVGALSEAEARSFMVPEEQWRLRKKLHDGEITLTQFDSEIARIQPFKPGHLGAAD